MPKPPILIVFDLRKPTNEELAEIARQIEVELGDIELASSKDISDLTPEEMKRVAIATW